MRIVLILVLLQVGMVVLHSGSNLRAQSEQKDRQYTVLMMALSLPNSFSARTKRAEVDNQEWQTLADGLQFRMSAQSIKPGEKAVFPAAGKKLTIECAGDARYQSQEFRIQSSRQHFLRYGRRRNRNRNRNRSRNEAGVWRPTHIRSLPLDLSQDRDALHFAEDSSNAIWNRFNGDECFLFAIVRSGDGPWLRELMTVKNPREFLTLALKSEAPSQMLLELAKFLSLEEAGLSASEIQDLMTRLAEDLEDAMDSRKLYFHGSKVLLHVPIEVARLRQNLPSQLPGGDDLDRVMRGLDLHIGGRQSKFYEFLRFHPHLDPSQRSIAFARRVSGIRSVDNIAQEIASLEAKKPLFSPWAFSTLLDRLKGIIGGRGKLDLAVIVVSSMVASFVGIIFMRLLARRMMFA